MDWFPFRLFYFTIFAQKVDMFTHWISCPLRRCCCWFPISGKLTSLAKDSLMRCSSMHWCDLPKVRIISDCSPTAKKTHQDIETRNTTKRRDMIKFPWQIPMIFGLFHRCRSLKALISSDLFKAHGAGCWSRKRRLFLDQEPTLLYMNFDIFWFHK